MYLLDTNAWIGYLKGRPAIVERVQREPKLAISTISLGELYYGARKSQRVEANLRRIDVLRSEVEVYEVNGMAAELYGLIRADLERQGSPIAPNDLWIAAIARANDAVLVSHNVGEFSRVVGLRLEDWEAAGS
ncbi:type II toxin-antitoxin system VapC family toxin [Calidithermus timidus]|jgi:tRNA(fMet)-specific endonuclease VapC|uniref:type II toxin-antitoxin system VapC family toxin n=1 Tax=Calidithermus timidus TaxID=307124 RepID=UPI00036FB5C5|nr:type II toxin-antitoxin system VapC family toxin [Calidithermus timidus]